MEYCAKCKREFGSAKLLEQHLRDPAWHPQCSICTTYFGFGTREELEEHLEVAPQQCAPCNKFFGNAEILLEHDVSVHIPCTVCSTYFALPHSLREVGFPSVRTKRNESHRCLSSSMCSIRRHIGPRPWNVSAATNFPLILSSTCSPRIRAEGVPQRQSDRGTPFSQPSIAYPASCENQKLILTRICSLMILFTCESFCQLTACGPT